MTDEVKVRVFREVLRVLKPGGLYAPLRRFGVSYPLEIFSTEIPGVAGLLVRGRALPGVQADRALALLRLG